MNRLEHRIPPPFVFLGIGALMWALSRLGPALPLERPWRLALALLLAACGALAIGLGFAAFRQARTTIDPVHIDAATALVVRGVFRYTRNPMYLGFTLGLAGWAVALDTAWALTGPVLFVLFIRRFQIAPEERAMEAKFGDAYLAYKRAVRRWI